MELTAEELAISGLIDAETYIQLTEAIRVGSTTVRKCFPGLDRQTVQRIRARAAEIWQQRRLPHTDNPVNAD
jgi:hypothetical protein